MKYLLDSDVLCAAVKGRLPVVIQLAALKPGDVAISVLARLEAERSLRALPRPQPRYGKLLRELLSHIAILDFGAAEAQHAVNIGVRMDGAEAALSTLDLLTAATALSHRLTLVTHRPAVFAGVPDLDVSDWLATS